MRIGISFKWKLAAMLFLVSAPRFAIADTAPSLERERGTESAVTVPRWQTHAQSDRVIAGLRGPVERCTDETRYDHGRSWRMIRETTYDPDGRISQVRSTNDDGTNSGVSKSEGSFTYDAEGHLLRTVWAGQDGSSEILRYYDSQGRLTRVTGEDDRWTTTFEYDDQGRKTRVVRSTGSEMGADPFFVFVTGNPDLFVAPPEGGWTTTSFNENDQPTETRAYGPNGELITRMTRSYDAKGHISESAYVIENLESLREELRETRKGLRSNPEALKAQLAQMLGDKNVAARVSYVYDDQGRVSEQHDDFGRSDNTITKITYNDHGDETQEVRTRSHPPSSPEEYDTHITYQYDSFGNWTERTVSSAPTGTEPLRTIDRRDIAYY